MNLQPHEIAVDVPALERSMRMYQEHTRKGLALLSRREGDVQAICRQAVQFSTWTACIILSIGRSDEEALLQFRQALAYGLIGLGAPGSSKQLRAYDVLMEIGEAGSRIVHEHERRSAREQRILSIADYSGVLQMAVCFGDAAVMEEVARYPEERYRNPNVVAGEDYYGYLRAWKLLLVGDERGATREMKLALGKSPQPAPRRDMLAFVDLLEGNLPSFVERLEERLERHKKQYQKDPGNPEGLICFPGLMLCRVAIDRQVAVEEWPYLPIRLLPNFRG